MRMKRSALVISILLLSLLTGVVHASPPGGTPPGLERAIQAQEANSERLMAIQGVVGTAVGLGPDGEAVVQVYLRERGVRGVPAHVNGVRVDTIVTGAFIAREDPTKRQDRPVPIGVSVGHPSITAGTIGARVKDSQGNVFALSNNHVLANTNKASIGDPMLQPGTFDGGQNPVDSIGTLAAFEQIRFCSGPFVSSCPANAMDAAIASTTTANLGTATLSNGYGTPGVTVTTAALGMSVQKAGRTTGLTTGQVSSINADVFVCYDSRCRHQDTARFTNQVLITDGTFSAGGDSGSLIVTTDGNNNPVALLFAGSSTHTIASPIGPVLTRFGVSIDDGSGEPTDPGDSGDPTGPNPSDPGDPADPDPTTIYVSSLSGQSINNGNTWTARVTITVSSDEGSATVTGSWSNGASGSTSCATNGAGQCTVEVGGIRKNVSSVTWSVTGISHGLDYDPAANVQTSITVSKP